MNEELAPLPLTKMRTLNKLSFWSYFIACILLYTTMLIFKSAETTPRVLYSSLIAFAIFIALFLELICLWVKNRSVARNLDIVCYVFEIISIIGLALTIFLK